MESFPASPDADLREGDIEDMGVEEAIEKVMASLRYLPPTARSHEALIDAIAEALRKLQPVEWQTPSKTQAIVTNHDNALVVAPHSSRISEGTYVEQAG